MWFWPLVSFLFSKIIERDLDAEIWTIEQNHCYRKDPKPDMGELQEIWGINPNLRSSSIIK